MTPSKQFRLAKRPLKRKKDRLNVKHRIPHKRLTDGSSEEHPLPKVQTTNTDTGRNQRSLERRKDYSRELEEKQVETPLKNQLPTCSKHNQQLQTINPTLRQGKKSINNNHEFRIPDKRIQKSQALTRVAIVDHNGGGGGGSRRRRWWWWPASGCVFRVFGNIVEREREMKRNMKRFSRLKFNEGNKGNRGFIGAFRKST